MKTTLLIFVVLSILALSVAPKSKKPTDVEKPEPEKQDKKEPTTDSKDTDKGSESDGKETNEDETSKPKKKSKAKSNDEDTDKSKKNSKATPATNKSSKKGTKDDDDDISENVDDILNDDDDEEEVEIPSLDDLDTESDPIELGEQIKSVTDPKKRKALVAELKKAWKENEGVLPGKFYQAAYASLSNKKGAQKKAQDFWDKQLKKVTENVKNPGSNILGKANSGMSKALENARKLAQADPVGIALRNGESVLLTALSDSLKNLSQVTDMAYDTTKNASKLVRALTFPVDSIPILSDIKNNVHDFIEEGADRGKFLSGSFAENGSSAFSMAAKNAKKKADEKQELLRQFTSTRVI